MSTARKVARLQCVRCERWTRADELDDGRCAACASEKACSQCGALTLTEFLADVAERVPFGGHVCPACESSLTAEEHAETDPECECLACTHARARSGRLSRREYVRHFPDSE